MKGFTRVEVLAMIAVALTFALVVLAATGHIVWK